MGVTSIRVHGGTPPARAIHTMVLRSFAATGHPPDPAALADGAPAGHDLTLVLGELHDRDVVRLDDDGKVRVAYPFSAVPTAHTVTIADGPTVWAMCAIDALGIAAMLGRDVSIAPNDPATGEPIRVRVTGGQATWTPDAAVVFDGADESTRDDPAGRECSMVVADGCCGVMNFFASRAGANAWLAAHPTVTGMVLTQEQALRLGVDIFGSLLED